MSLLHCAQEDMRGYPFQSFDSEDQRHKPSKGQRTAMHDLIRGMDLSKGGAHLPHNDGSPIHLAPRQPCTSTVQGGLHTAASVEISVGCKHILSSKVRPLSMKLSSASSTCCNLPPAGKPELLRPEATANPYLHRLYGLLAARALDSEVRIAPRYSARTGI